MDTDWAIMYSIRRTNKYLMEPGLFRQRQCAWTAKNFGGLLTQVMMRVYLRSCTVRGQTSIALLKILVTLNKIAIPCVRDTTEMIGPEVLILNITVRRDKNARHGGITSEKTANMYA